MNSNGINEAFIEDRRVRMITPLEDKVILLLEEAMEYLKRIVKINNELTEV